MQSRPTNVVRLFNLDPDEKATEARFRSTLLDIGKALTGFVALTVDTNIHLSLVNYFSGATTIRSVMPEADGDSLVAGSWPSEDFGGVVKGIDLVALDSKIGQFTVVSPNMGVPLLLPTGSVLLPLRAPSSHRILLQGSSNLSDWTMVEVRSAQAGAASFLIPNALEGYHYFQANDIESSGSLVVRLRDSTNGEPIVGARTEVTLRGQRFVLRSNDSGRVIATLGSGMQIFGQASVKLDAIGPYPAQTRTFDLPQGYFTEVVFVVAR